MSEASGAVIRPGFVGLIIVGAIAAVLSWGLYGPLANVTIFGGSDSASDEDDNFGITVAALAGAVLVGVGGSKWLASAVDKALLQQAATAAAQGKPDANQASQIRDAAPTEALRLAKGLTP